MTDQSRRSAERIRGLCPDFRYTDNWCRSAAFSACNDNRVRADVVTNIRMNWINRITDCRIGHHPGLCNKINMLPFSGPPIIWLRAPLWRGLQVCGPHLQQARHTRTNAKIGRLVVQLRTLEEPQGSAKALWTGRGEAPDDPDRGGRRYQCAADLMPHSWAMRH